MEFSRICVYCGSSTGTGPDFADAAWSLGELLARNGITVVYGGAAVGLMGVLADAALAAGGQVIGVIPRHLISHEIAHPGLTELVEVGSMHERKQAMYELADAFVALPGGLGTLEERHRDRHLGPARPAPQADCDPGRRRLLGGLSTLSCGRRPTAGS